MKHIINKYDYLSGKLLQQYSSISEATKDNNLTYPTTYKMLQQDMIKYPRNDYYLAYKPKKRWVIKCYDNETRLLLGIYRNIKEAAKKTGVDWQQIEWQISRNLDFNKRRMGCTGLWFTREVIDK